MTWKHLLTGTNNQTRLVLKIGSIFKTKLIHVFNNVYLIITVTIGTPLPIDKVMTKFRLYE